MDGELYNQALTDLEAGSNIGAACQNRRATAGRNTGGGVAVWFRKNKVSMKLYPFRRNGCEIVAVKGKLQNSTQPLYVAAVYLPPGMTKKNSDRYIDTLRGLVDKIEMQEKNPRMIIAGDINPLRPRSFFQFRPFRPRYLF